MSSKVKKKILKLKESSTLVINEKSKELISKGKKVYQFGFGQSPFPVPEKIVEALKKNAHRKEYLPIQGLLKLREAISSTYDNGSHNDIITFAGAEEGLYVAMKCILNISDHAIVITPNYQSAETLPNSICEVTGIALDPNNNWSLDITKIKDSIKKETDKIHTLTTEANDKKTLILKLL